MFVLHIIYLTSMALEVPFENQSEGQLAKRSASSECTMLETNTCLELNPRKATPFAAHSEM